MLSFGVGDTLTDKLEFVETHVHFYDMQHPEPVYRGWHPDVPHPVMA